MNNRFQLPPERKLVQITEMTTSDRVRRMAFVTRPMKDGEEPETYEIIFPLGENQFSDLKIIIEEID